MDSGRFKQEKKKPYKTIKYRTSITHMKITLRQNLSVTFHVISKRNKRKKKPQIGNTFDLVCGRKLEERDEQQDTDTSDSDWIDYRCPSLDQHHFFFLRSTAHPESHKDDSKHEGNVNFNQRRKNYFHNLVLFLGENEHKKKEIKADITCAVGRMFDGNIVLNKDKERIWITNKYGAIKQVFSLAGLRRAIEAWGEVILGGKGILKVNSRMFAFQECWVKSQGHKRSLRICCSERNILLCLRQRKQYLEH